MPKNPRQPSAKTVTDLPLVVVIWADASVDPSYDGPLDELRPGIVINHTIGYLARRDKHELTLVRDITPADNTVRWPYHIPTKLVKEIKTLSLAPPNNSNTQFPEGERGS